MRTLLIDGDVPCHMHAYSNDNIHDFDGVECRDVDYDKAKEDTDEEIVNLMRKLKADRVIIALSDDRNWRYSVLPSYKHNRDDKERPELHAVIKQHLWDSYDARTLPRAEGDDVMGVMATDPERPHGETVIVSIDKDMRTIPGWLFRPHKDDDKPIWVSPDEAERYHLYQTLIGDTTDGYKGCPGVGDKTACELLDAPWLEVPYEHEFKRGKRKGETETRYEKVATGWVWQAIVSQYEKKGLTEEDAVQQARVARICRYEDWNHSRREPILWTPACISHV